VRLLSRFLQQDTHDLRRWHHHPGGSEGFLSLRFTSVRVARHIADRSEQVEPAVILR
jgi:hypothetical protein